MNEELIALRPATSADEQFANDLLFDTMHRYVEATWPNNQAAHRRYYKKNKFDPSNTRIVQIHAFDIGRLSTRVLSDCVFIDELHIVPEYQRQGIGQRVIRQVFKEAREVNLPVKLTVLTVNPAQNLYLRMGFKLITEMDHRLHMECSLESISNTGPPGTRPNESDDDEK